jgi:MFS family permease
MRIATAERNVTAERRVTIKTADGFGGTFLLVMVITVTLFVQAVTSLLGAAIPVLAPDIAADRGWNATLIAFYPALVRLMAFITSFKVPHFLDRLGGMGLNLACICISAAGLLCALSPTPIIVILAPLAIGVATAAMNPASSQILASRTPVRMTGFVMALKQTGVPLGTALAGIILPIFVWRFQWQLTVTGLALISGVVAIALIPTSRWLNGSSSPSAGPYKARPYKPFDPVKQLLAMRGMPQFLVASMAAGAAQSCLRAFYPVYLVKSVGLDLPTAGMIFGVSQVAGIFGQIVWASLSDRALRPHTTIGLLALTIAIASALSAILSPHWPLVEIAIIAVLFGFGAAGFMPVVLAEIARKAPSGQAGALTSGANVFLFAASGIGPLLYGWVAASLSYPAAFASLAAIAALGGVGALRFREIPPPSAPR